MEGGKKIPGRIDEIREGGLNEDDTLCISNGQNWFGYKQLGKAKVRRPHGFKAGQKVTVELDEKGKIVSVESETGIASTAEIRTSYVCGVDDEHLHIDIAVSPKLYKAGEDVRVTIEKMA